MPRWNRFENRAWDYLEREYPSLQLYDQTVLPSGKRSDFILVENALTLALRKNEQKIVVAEAKDVNKLIFDHVDQVVGYRSSIEKLLKQNVYETLIIVSKRTEVNDDVWDYLQECYVRLVKLRSM